MNVVKVCRNVWLDQDSNKFVCEKCGKAKFDTRAQAIGHQSVCPMNDMKYFGARGPAQIIDNGSNTTSGVVVKVVADSGGSQADLSGSPEMDSKRKIAILSQQVASLQQTLAKYENEIPHRQAIQVAQQVGSLGSLSPNALFLIGIGVIMLMYLVSQDSKSCNAETSQKRGSGGGIGTALLTKGASKIIDKTIDKFLGK
jgi:hypothetical protein